MVSHFVSRRRFPRHWQLKFAGVSASGGNVTWSRCGCRALCMFSSSSCALGRRDSLVPHSCILPDLVFPRRHRAHYSRCRILHPVLLGHCQHSNCFSFIVPPFSSLLTSGTSSSRPQHPVLDSSSLLTTSLACTPTTLAAKTLSSLSRSTVLWLLRSGFSGAWESCLTSFLSRLEGNFGKDFLRTLSFFCFKLSNLKSSLTRFL